ncbi:hypothetical protein Bhyg_06727, partial [Pseudolycoriella hygida]
NKDEQWVRTAFKKIDSIESVEIFEENGRTWAYLTYEDSGDVYRAIRDAPQLEEVEVVLPADTWVQKTSFSHPVVDCEALVVALNKYEASLSTGQTHDVLSIKELISMATKTDSLSVKEALDRILPWVKNFEFTITNNDGVAVLLSEVRSTLRCIGQHICHLSITFRMSIYPKYINRYWEKICQYAGPQLNSLKLTCIPNNQEWLVTLQPLLNRIQHLDVLMINYDINYDIDFALYCPNLISLKIFMNLNGTLLCKNQPTLQHLTMLHNDFMDHIFQDFLRNNPQLVYLKISANDCIGLLQKIALHLPALQGLCLHRGYPEIRAEYLDCLTTLKHLRNLELVKLNKCNFDAILSCLPKFKQLEGLELYVFYDDIYNVDVNLIHEPYPDLIITLAQELLHLERFYLRFCKIDSATLCEFVRHAKNLRTLGLYGCGLVITEAELDVIETIRLTFNRPMLVIYADQIHSELNREKVYRAVNLVAKTSLSGNC